jgi:AcrR family transcriptional regulator
MKRVRTKSEEKRVLIVDAAVALFLELGYDAVTMDKIAKHAGVSKQTVYSHYGSKEDLFTAAIGDKCISYDLDPESIAQLGNAEDALMTIAHRFVKMIYSEEGIKLHRTCIAQAETHPQLAKLFFEAGPVHTRSVIAELLASFDSKGELSVEKPAIAAAQFLNIIQGEMSLRAPLLLEHLPAEAHKEYVNESVKAFVRAYKG